MCTNILLDLFMGLFDVAFLGALLLLVNFYTSATPVQKPVYFQYLAGKNALVLLSLFAALYGIKNWAGYHVAKSQNFFFYNVASRLSGRNIRNFLRDNHIQYVNTDSSVLIRKISQQPIELSSYILTNVQQVISQGILICFTVTGILFYHPALFISLFALLLPPVILLGSFIKRKLRYIRESTKTTSQLTLQYLKESLSGYVESNVYGKNDFFADRFYRHQNQLNQNIASQQTLQGLPPRLIEVFAVLGFLILVSVNKFSANGHGVGLLDVGVFMAASYKIIPGIVKILNNVGLIKTYEFTLNDLAADAEIEAPKVNTRITDIYSIKFNQVSFNYKQQEILGKLSFEISSGDFIGISGPSGQGKTTIINLLLGFLEQNSGVIYINHKTTTFTERQQFWNKISYIKQQPFFINDTILKNITLTDGDYDKRKLNEAIAFCGIAGMLAQYPEGIDKQITENGNNISGGQRQRIMLARALCHDFDVLVLDEPFSEMDEASEKDILNKMELLAKKGKIIIMITHNKSSLSFCNKILSLDAEYA